MTDWTTARVTPETLAELRRLLDVNRGRYFHALPWHAWDRGIGYELHVGATCRDKMEPRGYCEGVNNGFRETFGAPEAELIVAAVNALPALLDAAAERDALVAAVERQKEGREYLRAERDALRNWSHDLQVELKGAEAQRQMLLAERDALAAAVERVRALHCGEYVEDEGRNRCFECGDDHPCPTIRAIDNEKAVQS